ncbi:MULTISPECIES: hypothetical protein [Burkholderia]|uniref:hypothetical protein n=1 Tax=Burkholderia TaxID=32008 RepID=UPI000398991D|nr:MULTISPECIES: hypothetical protein [Burkholderia]ERJ37684.1 hypothetical protein L810_7913 [Burkholderia sp. AU4i]MBA9948200.1 hypothetical protein [Burkholderia cepacia]MBA9978328.1 hypothetical protein [Burkholderia cepacia]MBA9996315.1 hypothetical protein [Burkholderia cepacia]MBB0004197.1 hypothetical protein [Burkholderia cepacia]
MRASGSVFERLLAGVAFFLLLSPVAILWRLWSDPLGRRWEPAMDSYRVRPNRSRRLDMSRMS